MSKVNKIFNAFEFVKPDAPTETGLYWPNQLNYLWEYCIYLGSIVDDRGRKLDLGVYTAGGMGELDGTVSDASAYGNEPENYKSGQLDLFLVTTEGHREHEHYKEVYRRALAHGLTPRLINTIRFPRKGEAK
tara:strand:+ start:521 stop:916 length:396 start_codon:yes stop_codon:yes gene_type:complete